MERKLFTGSNLEGFMNTLLELIRDLFKEKKDKLNCVTQCKVAALNLDLSADLCALSDTENVIKNISNPFNIYCEVDDVVLLYKPNNDFNSSFIIANKTRRDRKSQVNGGRIIFGITGGQGPTGIVGPTGMNGFEGVPGPGGGGGPGGDGGKDGKDGKDGEQGPTGPTGPTGADGKDGKDGEQGPTGPTGPTGADGKDGKDGEQGPTGATGPTGSNVGPTGPRGDKGSRGTPSEYNGSAAIYFDPENNLSQSVSAGGETLRLDVLASKYIDKYQYFILINKNSPKEKYKVFKIEEGGLFGVSELVAEYVSYIREDREFATDLKHHELFYTVPIYKKIKKIYRANSTSSTLEEDLSPYMTIYLCTPELIGANTGSFSSVVTDILQNYITRQKKVRLTLKWYGNKGAEYYEDVYFGDYSKDSNVFLATNYEYRYTKKLTIRNYGWEIEN